MSFYQLMLITLAVFIFILLFVTPVPPQLNVSMSLHRDIENIEKR